MADCLLSEKNACDVTGKTWIKPKESFTIL